MAKAFLIRWGYQNDFDSIKLQTRELGFAVDAEKLYIGSDDSNIHIPNEAYVERMIDSGVLAYKPVTGTTLELQSAQPVGSLSFNSDDKKIQYKMASGTIIKLANVIDLPSGEATSVTVSLENIDVGNFNSVTLSSYTRPIKLVFLNGSLCTNNPDDPHRYVIDPVNSTITIKECAEGDIIAYF